MKKLLGPCLAALLLVAGCSSGAEEPSNEPIKIAWISPDATTSTRWDTLDRPAFERSVKELAPDATILASTAPTDQEQLQAAESAIAQGADVIVINPITSEGAAPIVDLAKREGIPVVAYEGLIINADIDGYISFDNTKVGVLQAQYIVDHVKPGATIAVMNGAQVCEACIAFKVGAHSVFDPLVESGDLVIGYEADTPDWLTENAQTQTEQALTALDDDVDAIYAANDGLAEGVIAALKARQLNGSVVVTGQDATVAGLQEILAGNLSMTVYKNFNVQAAAGAKAAVALAQGKTDAADTGLTQTFDNGFEDVPSVLLDPVALDKSNITQVFDDGLYTRDQICTGDVASLCDF